MSSDTACAVADPELFFPPTYGAAYGPQIAAAKALCGRCLARSACLQRALETPEDFGIWGGTTPTERARRRLRPRQVQRRD